MALQYIPAGQTLESQTTSTKPSDALGLAEGLRPCAVTPQGGRDAVAVPLPATLFCVAVELYTSHVAPPLRSATWAGSSYVSAARAEFG